MERGEGFSATESKRANGRVLHGLGLNGLALAELWVVKGCWT